MLWRFLLPLFHDITLKVAEGFLPRKCNLLQDRKLKTRDVTNGVLLYLEGKVQLKHFYKNQYKTHPTLQD
jgi:hypothetical protein